MYTSMQLGIPLLIVLYFGSVASPKTANCQIKFSVNTTGYIANVTLIEALNLSIYSYISIDSLVMLTFIYMTVTNMA